MKLHECCLLIVDCEHKTAPTQDVGYPSIRTPNIGRGYFILEGVNRVSEATYRQWTQRAVPQVGDLIMAREAPVGNVAMVPKGLSPCLGQRTLLIRPDVKRVDPRFLTYLLIGPCVQSIIHSQTNGATVPHLNMKDVRNLDLPSLPDLSEQKRIAGILSAYDDLIENCERRIRVLNEMARSLYREWFGIGSGVARGRFAHVAAIFRDSVDPRQCPEEEFAHFSIPAFDVGRRPAIEHGRSIQSVKTALPQGCVLLSKLNPRIPRVWMPKWSPTRRAIASTEFLVLQGQRDGSASFLYCLCSSPEFMASFASMAIGTSTSHQRVKPESLLQMDVPVPKESTIREFDAAVAPQLELAEVLRERAANLRATRDLLLPRLLSGQLSVDDAA